MTNRNPSLGLATRFGPLWPGQRCGAKTRRGTKCQRPANKKNGRCRLHGGASTGAKSEAGLQKIHAANLRHGFRSRDFLEKRKRIWAQLREIERQMRADGTL